MGFPKSFKTIEIEQDCAYGFTPDYTSKLCENWSVIKDYAWIVHDKDVKEDGTPREPHIHLMLRFNDSVPTTAILAKLQGVCQIQHLQRMKRWGSALAYLCHMNAPDKHLYEQSEVHSNFDWVTPALASITPKQRTEQIIHDISTGVIKRYNIHEHMTAEEYVNNERKILAAFSYRDNMLFNEVNRKMDVIYIYGDSGTGKTTYAKQLASDRGLSVFVSAGGQDFLDGYNGQECIILDEFRGSSAPLSVILKLLDNNTASSVPSRYRNKSIAECKLIIITSIQAPEELFHSAFQDNNEPLIQFRRRCGLVMHFHVDKIIFKLFNSNLGTYEIVSEIPNVVLDNLKRDYTPENKKDYFKRLLGGFGDVFSALEQSIDRGDIKIEDNDGEQHEIPF